MTLEKLLDLNPHFRDKPHSIRPGQVVNLGKPGGFDFWDRTIGNLNLAFDWTGNLWDTSVNFFRGLLGIEAPSIVLTSQQETFFTEIAPLIQTGVLGQGILPSVAIAQAALESGWEKRHMKLYLESKERVLTVKQQNI